VTEPASDPTPSSEARTSSEGAFLAVDRGTATVAVSLVGRVAGSWRLLGAAQAPAGVDESSLAERLRARLADADPELAAAAGLADTGSTANLARLRCATERAPELAVVAATRRVAAPLADIAATAGWRVRELVIDGAEILPVATALADPRVTAVLAGASDPPGADERSLLPDLGAVVAAAGQRRPDLVTVLAGGLATPGGRVDASFADRAGSTILAPAATAGGGAPLRRLLDGLRGGTDDGRRALAAATGTLAEVLRRGVEVVEIGQSGASRIVAGWSPAGGAEVRWASVPAAALLPAAFTDAHLDAITAWLTSPPDRLRVRDRLRELAIAPWSDAAGDGALLRLAAARAALIRLARATRDLDDGRQPPELLVAAGGPWAVAPGPAVGLALADALRRPGVRAMGWDHARLLAPLGMIEDPEERRAVIADLRDELLLPLGSLVLPAGLRVGHPGRLTVRGDGEPIEVELNPGGLELVDLPPGERATVELRFRDAVDLGVRSRHAAVEVVGGLGGLIVDLRDVPLRLPDRPERRRDLLAAWQGALWAGVDA
jgi:hypothetical protein